MFITARGIESFKDKANDPRLQVAIGTDLEYLFLTDGGSGVCGMPAILVDMEKDPEAEDSDAPPFFMSIAVVTEVPEVYAYFPRRRVVRAEVERIEGAPPAKPTVMKADEVDRIIYLINRNAVDNKKHLKLVKNDSTAE